MNIKILHLILFFIAQFQIGVEEKKCHHKMEYNLSYATYFTQIDKGGPAFDIFTDDEGFMYISGNTKDENYPTTPGAYQSKLKGDADAFVAKFSPNGKLIFSTLIGGSKREHHTGLTVDKDGNIYLVGGTHSSDFPTTPQAYDRTFNGEKDWAGDVFLLKLNPTGDDIIFSTFVGGRVQETADVVHIDKKGNILIGGCTLSSNFPTTVGAIDRTFRGFEAFLSKFSPNGDNLLFSTLLGGNGNEDISCITTDDNNNIYVAGFTRSTDFPVTENASRNKSENINDSEWWEGTDNYLAKLNENGTKLIYSSFLGGKSRPPHSLIWSAPNKLLFAGNTNTKSFPVSKNAIFKEFKGDRDGFISIFNTDNMELEYSTLFGGNQYDLVRDVFFINKDCVVLGGETNSPDFPVTENALDDTYPNADSTFNSGFFGNRRFFISIIDIKNNQLVYSTYFGGGKRFRICPDKLGNLGYFGETGLSDFPITDNAFRKDPVSFVLGRLILKQPNSIGDHIFVE